MSARNSTEDAAALVLTILPAWGVIVMVVMATVVMKCRPSLVMVIDPVRVEPWQAMGNGRAQQEERHKRVYGER